MRTVRRREDQLAMLRGEALGLGLKIVDTTPRSFSRSSSMMISSETQWPMKEGNFCIQVSAVNGQAVDEEEKANSSGLGLPLHQC